MASWTFVIIKWGIGLLPDYRIHVSETTCHCWTVELLNKRPSWCVTTVITVSAIQNSHWLPTITDALFWVNINLCFSVLMSAIPRHRAILTDDDVMKQKSFPHYGCFVRGFPSQRPVTRTSDVSVMLARTKWTNTRFAGDLRHHDHATSLYMMTSSNGNIFRVTDHLCGEFTGHRWIPRKKASDAELWCFLWSASG